MYFQIFHDVTLANVHVDPVYDMMVIVYTPLVNVKRKTRLVTLVDRIKW